MYRTRVPWGCHRPPTRRAPFLRRMADESPDKGGTPSSAETPCSRRVRISSACSKPSCVLARRSDYGLAAMGSASLTTPALSRDSRRLRRPGPITRGNGKVAVPRRSPCWLGLSPQSNLTFTIRPDTQWTLGRPASTINATGPPDWSCSEFRQELQQRIARLKATDRGRRRSKLF